MEYISIKGLNKPVSALMKGTDYFYHDSYEKAAANLDAYLPLAATRLIPRIYTAAVKAKK
ncbi:oxidoreductase, aldo/keto reductase family [Paenibacillus sp. JCM 10914]|nr:oxidoreductase, aldo/keto reductase family [Paenibacillus sp. JCM 10914]